MRTTIYIIHIFQCCFFSAGNSWNNILYEIWVVGGNQKTIKKIHELNECSNIYNHSHMYTEHTHTTTHNHFTLVELL